MGIFMVISHDRPWCFKVDLVLFILYIIVDTGLSMSSCLQGMVVLPNNLLTLIFYFIVYLFPNH